MRVQSDSVVFAYSGATLVSGGNTYLQDFGPNGFHMRFGAGAAAPTPQLDGSLYFDGGDYCYWDGDLTRYYAKMPVGELTWLTVWRRETIVPEGPIFSAFSNAGAVFRGVLITTSAGTDALRWYQGQGGAGLPAVSIAGVSSNARFHALAGTSEATPRAILNDSLIASAWGGGAFGACVYNTAQLPYIGRYDIGPSYLTGRIAHIACIRGAVSSADLAELCSMLRNATSGTSPWPFCVR